MSDGKRAAIVTGASRGIGAAIARRLGREGVRVACVARTGDAVQSLAREIGGMAIAADVTSKGASESIVAEAEAKLGPVDVLVPNAGIEASFKVTDTTDETWDAVMAINATAVFRLVRAALPKMIERGRGRIVVVASNAGLTGYAYTSAYCASKHAVVGLVRAVAAEIARTQVTINAVCPGFVDTSMSDRSIARIQQKTGRDASAARAALEKISPQRRILAPEEVAHLVASLIHDDARGIHGQTIAIDGGQTLG
jgi:NAD(P)-dependent dehydrogenase (short-subunit alcohol dehydrogenase family)